MTSIGAVIITHNSQRQIGPCLDSLPRDVTALVVDNASSDGTLDEVAHHPRVRVIANPWNRGFAAAANQGFGALDCDLILLLNPDVEVTEGLDSMAAECKIPGVGAAGGKLSEPDGRLQVGFMIRRFPTPRSLALEVMGINRLWPGNPENRRYRCTDFDPTQPASVDQPAGAFLMVRREVWRQLGGFDEQFQPVWFEDVDFLKRTQEAGYAIRYVPSACAKHEGGHSVRKIPAPARDLWWYGNLLKYAAKHFTRTGVLAVSSAVMAGAFFRGILGFFRSLSIRPVRTYTRVFRLAAAQFLRSPAGPGLKVYRPVGTADGVIR